MKKVILVIISAILVVAIVWFAPPIKLPNSAKPVVAAVPTQSPSSLPTPTPSPLLNIDKNSNLSQESQKLSVPDYQSDYDGLNKTLSQF